MARIRPFSPIIVYTKDVSKGGELQQIFLINYDGSDKYKYEDFKPKRIFGIGFDGKIITLSAASMKTIELWILKPYDKSERVYESNQLFFVTDVGYNKVVGKVY